MKSFVKNALYSLGFLLGLFVLLALSSLLFRPKDNSPEAGMDEPAANGILGEPQNTIDVLLLGDSESYTSLIPLQIWEQYGITCYCCGTAGQTLSHAQEYLHQAFKRQSPKVVLLETDTLFAKFSSADFLRRKWENLFPVIKYHSRWKELTPKDFRLNVRYTYVDFAKGYEFSDAVAPASVEGYMAEDEGFAPILPQAREHMERMKEYCDEKGATLILYSSPSTANWNMLRHNTTQKLAEEMGVAYVDMNLLREEIPIDWQTESRDNGDHLNYAGAVKATDYMGAYLAKTGLLESHWEDSAYAHWNEQAKAFYEEISGK